MGLKILFLEPFYGGSHKDFADGLVKHSRHRITLKTLPDRYWKWRMRGAALHFARTVDKPEDYDLLFTTDLMSLSDLRALWGSRCPPALVYFHENQLAYPLAEGEKMDYQFGFTDITTGLAADQVIFNSRSHREAFFQALPGFIRKMPEFKPHWAVEVIKEKSSVLYPGCHLPPRDLLSPSSEDPKEPETKARHGGTPNRRPTGGKKRPLVIWNHRWEFDKNPESFFACLREARRRGAEFDLALLGENFQARPREFIAAEEEFGDTLLQYGYVKSRREYENWLARGDLALSTSRQENFGISVVEAVYFGAWPLLPRRLSYPELIPEKFHPSVLYDDEEDLLDKFCHRLEDIRRGGLPDSELSGAMERFSWKNQIAQYDKLFERAVAPVTINA